MRRLLARIREEQERTQQDAVVVRISRNTALELASMDADEWFEAGNGFVNLQKCESLANDFARDGIQAANGLKLSIIGPTLVVASDHRAPDVEIIQGNPDN